MVHSFYDDLAPSGENTVVDAQVAALTRAGHEVSLHSVRTSQSKDEFLFTTRAAARVATGQGRSPEIDHDAELVHVHNTFPNFGRRWVKGLDIPHVVTLHNYRPVCAQPMLLREGTHCELCVTGSALNSLRHACYRGSRVRTLPLALSMVGGPMGDPMLDRAARLLVMNQAMAEVYARAGVPRDRMGVAPSFLPDDEDPGWGAAPVSRAAPWLFVGRLGREKGILDLVRSWPTGHRLLIAGAGGEDHEAVADAAGPSVELLGQLRRADVLAIMRECRGLVFPSKWLEGSPLVVVEALAVGLPILAFEPTALAGTVEHDLIGRRVTRDADLAAVLADAAHAFSDLRGRCRTHFERVHSEAAFLARTESMYAAALR